MEKHTAEAGGEDGEKLLCDSGQLFSTTQQNCLEPDWKFKVFTLSRSTKPQDPVKLLPSGLIGQWVMYPGLRRHADHLTWRKPNVDPGHGVSLLAWKQLSIKEKTTWFPDSH
ncbi:unnamed protein product [Pleuronectes platessa]|uniref:Uncharacterized protein n=1 Tax=Pleuronectes platessa TaxID=8262 RepID=A0A9N7ZG65_PLEPL|nr:unnamed protein product [Pleuronectes platessa]